MLKPLILVIVQQEECKGEKTMESVKEIFKVCVGEESNDYYTQRTDMSGLDELNVIRMLCDDFKSRITSKAGKEKAEDLIWHATQGAKFYIKNDELYIQLKEL